MKQTPGALIAQVMSEIEKNAVRELHPLQMISRCLETVQEALEALKVYQDETTFASEKDMIHFYKSVKPELDFRLVYYNRLLRIEQGCPISGQDHIRAYYRQEQQKIHDFYLRHDEFVRYYRLEGRHLDPYYFIPTKGPLPAASADEHLLYSYHYNAPMSHTLACVKAYDQLQQDLEQKIWWLEHDKGPSSQSASPSGPIQFTGKKVDFIEQILAWHASAVINNGTLPLKELVDYCCAFFNVRISNFYKILEEIAQRKKARSAFCQAMQVNLERYLDMRDMQTL